MYISYLKRKRKVITYEAGFGVSTTNDIKYSDDVVLLAFIKIERIFTDIVERLSQNNSHNVHVTRVYQKISVIIFEKEMFN